MGGAIIKPDTSFLELSDEALEAAIRSAYNEDPQKMNRILNWGIDITAREQFSQYTTLDEETMATIEATIPALEAHGLAITTHMYELMFNQNPEVALMFTSREGAEERKQAQARALAGSILGYAQNIRDLSVLGDVVARIAARHTASDVGPHHYNIVGGHLLQSIRDVLGDAATDGIMKAWANGYFFLTRILVELEEQMKAEKASQEGGWRGCREFYVSNIEHHCDRIKTITLTPQDHGQVVQGKAGQFITLKLHTNDSKPFLRNYSLSHPSDGNSYRITVKRIGDGLSSNMLCDMNVNDRIELLVPYGTLTLDRCSNASDGRTIVLVSGGIGSTPLHCMTKSMDDTESKSNDTVYWIHQSRTSEDNIFSSSIHESQKTNEQFHSHVYYSNETNDDNNDDAHTHYKARVTADDIYTIVGEDAKEAWFYVCGPESFMHDIINGLKEKNVSSDHIFHEFFGPTQF